MTNKRNKVSIVVSRAIMDRDRIQWGTFNVWQAKMSLKYTSSSTNDVRLHE